MWRSRSWIHAGEVIRTFSSAGSDGSNDHAAGPAVTVKPGLNRFVWDMLYPGVLSVPGDLATAGKPTSHLTRRPDNTQCACP